MEGAVQSHRVSVSKGKMFNSLSLLRAAEGVI